MKRCSCEHWQICPTCYPQGFDEHGVRKPVEVPPSREELQRQAVALREQVEKLTKDRDAEIARNRPLQSLIKSTEKTKSFLLKKSEENKEAVKQLDSERQANALLTEELAALAALKLARDALGEVQDLIGESHGVYGLHLNGDESPWGELEQGGRFERLTLLNEALAAINEVLGE